MLFELYSGREVTRLGSNSFDYLSSLLKLYVEHQMTLFLILAEKQRKLTVPRLELGMKVFDSYLLEYM